MIEDLRFVLVPSDDSQGGTKISKILQAYDGHQWYAVPLVALPLVTDGV